MASLSNESTPRERLARMITLTKRARKFWRSSAAIAFVGLAIALAVALHTKRVFRSETTVLFREGLPTREGEGESAAARVARLGPKLKDLLYARPQLEEVIRQYDLFPEKTRRSMLDGIEEMQTAIGFRARASDSFVVSFSYDDPAVAQDVAARLAKMMTDDYNQQNLDTATLARDFLKRKQAEAESGVDESSRKLAEFLAQHPQFQWGVNDSPYAPTPAGPGAPGFGAGVAPRPAVAAPSDPVLAGLERERARVEAELFPGQPGRAYAGPGAMAAEAQKQRDAAAAALAAAQSALAEKLLSVKPAHPDAISARGRVDAARQALGAADAALARARAGEAAPAPVPARPGRGPAPTRRVELERRRVALAHEIEARRAAHAGSAAAQAERPSPRDATADVVELETDWHRLRLNLDRAREKLHTIQQAARAADLSADAVARQGHEEMQILEPAYLPTRPDRGHGRAFFIGATIALFLALGYAVSRVLLDDTLLDDGDVAALGGPPVLVVMPRVGTPPPPARAIIPATPAHDGAGDEDDEDDDADDEEKRKAPPAPGREDTPSSPPPPAEPGQPAPPPVPKQRGIVLHAGARPIVEVVFDDPEVEVIGAVPPDGGPPITAPPALAALRILRHRLEQRRGDGSFVVSVMSPGLAEGKTTLALRLAVTLSEASRARVVLVEGSFERPRLAASLGLKLPAAAGFSAQIHERMDGRSAAWGVVRLGPSLSLLAEPEEGAAHPEALHSALFETAIAALRRSYDYVVIDGPGVVGSGDANVIESTSDGVLLLLRIGATKGAALTRAMQQLGERRVLGAVLNAADAPA